MFAIAATLVVFIVTLLYVYTWQKHQYWKSKGIPTPRVLPIIGHMYINLSGKRWEEIDKIYKKYKSNGFWGMYETLQPVLCVSDPVYIREILVKEADHFIDRRTMTLLGEKEKIFNEMLVLLKGEKWKALRSILSPTFTSGKMKSMFPLIDDKVTDLIQEIEKEMSEKSFVETKSFFGYFTMDAIATSAFGIDAHCIRNKEKSSFIKNGNELSNFRFSQVFKFLIMLIFPKLYIALGLEIREKGCIPFFAKVVEETIALRKKSGVKRGDFLDLILEAFEESEKKGNSSKYPMTMNTVIAQSILFIMAGFDNTASSLAFMAYLLAKNPEAQDKLRKELQKNVEADGELTYQNVMESQYLDACISETLRIYSPAHFTERMCTRNFTLPGTELEIQEGMLVNFPTWSLHYDPEYWEDPLSFRPERFLPENKGNINQYAYLPFGHGPRNCIGVRFAQIEVKLAIARICLQYEMTLRPGFTEMVLDKTMTTLRPNEDGVQMVFKKVVT